MQIYYTFWQVFNKITNAYLDKTDEVILFSQFISIFLDGDNLPLV